MAKVLAARALPIEGKQKLAAAGNALDAELTTLLDWMNAQDAGLGRSAETAASKMRYQMNRLRTLAANFQLQREVSGRRPPGAIARRSVLFRSLRLRAGGRDHRAGSECLPWAHGAVAVTPVL